MRSRNGVTNSTTTLGEVLLEVAVAAPGVLLLEVGDGAAGERGVDRQQVADARLLLGVEADLRAGVGDRRADLLGADPAGRRASR